MIELMFFFIIDRTDGLMSLSNVLVHMHIISHQFFSV
jgi:hypothetical protein